MKQLLLLLTLASTLMINAATVLNFGTGATSTNDANGNPVINVTMPIADTSITVATNGGTVGLGVSSINLSFVNGASGLGMSTNGFLMFGNICYNITTLTQLNNGTNFIMDMSLPSQVIIADTNIINFLYATNGMLNRECNVSLRIWAGNTNRDIWFTPTWLKATNAPSSNFFQLKSNQWGYVAVQATGTNQTNVAWAIVPMQ